MYLVSTMTMSRTQPINNSLLKNYFPTGTGAFTEHSPKVNKFTLEDIMSYQSSTTSTMTNYVNAERELLSIRFILSIGYETVFGA